jgi:phosphatidylinositol phospholipase C delta
MSALLQSQNQIRPVQVHTTSTQSSTSGPLSAISGSSVASNSQQGSPIMSPDTAILTSSSSVQASPEAMPALDEDQCLPNFQLPESIISRVTSTNSSVQGLLDHSQPIPEVSSTDGTPLTPSNPKTSLIRRLSSRASRRITNRRRQSSVAPTSRDASVGPCLLRRRSDSNNTAPPDFQSVAVDSESDVDENDDLRSLKSLSGQDGFMRGSSANSTTGSAVGLSNTLAGPVIPPQLLHGTMVTKVSKKGRSKKVCVVYDPDSSRLVWDKKRPNKFVHLDEILAVRSGSDVQQYGIDLNIPDVTALFTIIYSVPKKTENKIMHLFAESKEACNIWTSFLDAMLVHRQEVMESLMAFDEQAISYYWQSEMSKQFGDQPRTEAQEELDLDAIKRLCQNLHIYSASTVLERNFSYADVRKRGRLNFAEFLEFVRRTNQRPDIQRIYHSIAGEPRRGITLDEFLTFMREVQQEDVDSNLNLWEKKFARLARKPKPYTSEKDDSRPMGALRMCEAVFIGFLASKQNGPLKDEPQFYTLDRPLNEYFISSSHNTYLLGRQVKGQSSIEGYITALSKGCRCVEVDAWDGPEEQPQVVHGRTLTTSISFREVIGAINKHAFVATLYPLIISIENHCSPSQQQVMFEIMKEIFGSRLIEEPLDFSTTLPSPSQLLERIAIKVKVPVEPSSTESQPPTGRRRGNSVNSTRSQPSIPESTVVGPSQSVPQSPMLTPSQPSRRPVTKARVNTIAEGEIFSDLPSSDNESGSDAGNGGRSSNKTVKVLGKLGVYCAGVKFSGFDTPDAKKFNHIFSFMESSFSRHSRTREAKMALDLHNMRYLMRVYPDGIRLSSSNFDPLIYWRRGVQMAALNWQTNDLGMQLNRAMFEGGTDSSGYCLKPDALRGIQVSPFNSNIAEGKKKRTRVSFSIDILSAQQLMRPANLHPSKSMNPYVEVEVFDGRASESKANNEESANMSGTPLRVQTEPIRENAFNPMFNDGHFKFQLVTKYPEFVFVKFTVKLSPNGESYNVKDQHGVASWTVKLNNLKNGYRTLPLENHEGVQYLFSTIFCKIQRQPDDTEVYIDAPRRVQEGNALKRVGDKVFGRINTSPRATVEKSSQEKSSFES